MKVKVEKVWNEGTRRVRPTNEDVQTLDTHCKQSRNTPKDPIPRSREDSPEDPSASGRRVEVSSGTFSRSEGEDEGGSSEEGSASLKKKQSDSSVKYIVE